MSRQVSQAQSGDGVATSVGQGHVLSILLFGVAVFVLSSLLALGANMIRNALLGPFAISATELLRLENPTGRDDRYVKVDGGELIGPILKATDTYRMPIVYWLLEQDGRYMLVEALERVPPTDQIGLLVVLPEDLGETVSKALSGELAPAMLNAAGIQYSLDERAPFRLVVLWFAALGTIALGVCIVMLVRATRLTLARVRNPR